MKQTLLMMILMMIVKDLTIQTIFYPVNNVHINQSLQLTDGFKA